MFVFFLRGKIRKISALKQRLLPGQRGLSALAGWLAFIGQASSFQVPPEVCDSIVDAGWKIQSHYPPGNYMSRPKVVGKMIFLFQRWDMVVPWRVIVDVPRN